MKYHFLNHDEREMIRHIREGHPIRQHPTEFLEAVLQLNISYLNTLAESAEDESEELGLHFISAEWPAELREVIAAIQDELRSRHVEHLPGGAP
jgi:hypothetical protein